MAFLNSSQIASLAIPLLHRSVVLPRTVERVAGTEFGGSSGDTITVRVRANRTANVQSSPGATISLDTIAETGVSLQVHHIYSAAALTDEDLTLNLEDFGAQVLQPAVQAVARKSEQYIADAINSLVADDAVSASATGDAYATAIKDASQALDEADVEAGNRWCAVSPGAARALLDYDAIEDASALGTASAVQDAIIGRFAGFNIVKSNALDAGSLCAYHRSAFVMGNRAPVQVSGVDSATASQDGFSLRVVRDFDASKLAEIVAVSTFAGAAVVDADRAYRVEVGS